MSEYSVDELLRRQEGRKRRLSETDSESLSESSAELRVSEDPDTGTSDVTRSDLPSFVVEDRLTSLRPVRTRQPPEPASDTTRTTFASLGISPALQKALTGMSIKVPTEVQAACIPPLLAGKSHRVF